MISRRAFLQGAIAVGAAGAMTGCAGVGREAGSLPVGSLPADTGSSSAAFRENSASIPAVYFTREISPAGLTRAWEALGVQPAGNVAVKLSTGEPGGHNFLQPEFIGDFVRSLGATIVECNTAYGGQRTTTESHLQAAADHGFTAIADVDIMDAEGSMSLPVEGGSHLTEDLVGGHLADYDYVVSLAHFKGHAMGGFGGAIKNCSIGIASREGKMLIHSAGSSTTSWGSPAQDDFLESMAEAAKAVSDHLGGVGGNICYVNVMNRLSVDCDCDSHPAEPEMADIGILASFDPVALDRACVDLVYAAEDGTALVERIESRNGVHTLVHAEAIGLGSQVYELIDLDGQATEEERMVITVTCEDAAVTYELNDSRAARDLYGQLPLTLDVEPFSDNEQTFYPPAQLDCSDAPLAQGGAGVLAYYRPWGDVVMFYSSFDGNGSLYELGRAVSGAEAIAGMTGSIEIARAP